MEFIKGYMDDAQFRHYLNDTTSAIFGFSFEKWYQAGYFEREYIPYSFLENDRIVANASANIMKFSYNGVEKCYIQIGTVMTRPEYRGRGLARELIEKILQDYEDSVDGFYLFGNLSAQGFYDRIGFKRLDQWKWYWDQPVERKQNSGFFTPAGTQRRQSYVNMLQTASAYAKFDHMNRRSLQMFYTMDMDDVYYCEELDCYVVMHSDGCTLHLDSIISNRELSVEEVVARVDGLYSRVEFGFTPKETQRFQSKHYDGGNDYRLFYLGEDLIVIEEDRLYFPILSHA